MKILKVSLTIFGFVIGLVGFSQTPNNCNDYTSVGTSGSSYNAGQPGCTSNVSGLVSGPAAWTGTGCAGTIVSTVVGPPVNCLTIAYTAVNTNDYATISVDGGGTVSVSAVNVGVTGCDQIGPWTCGGSYGDCSVTVYSTAPFTQVTLTNTGCSSGWVINCSDQVPCTGGGSGGNAGADDFSTVMCGGIIDLNTLVTGDPGGVWTETTTSGQFTPGSGNFDAGGLTPAIYTFEYFIAGSGCVGDDTAFFSVEIVPPADANWTLPGALCSNATPIDLDLLVTGLAGGTWSGTGVTGNTFDPSSGSQNITYTVGVAPCDDNLMQNIVVTPSLLPTWTSPGTICEAAGPIDLNTLVTGDLGGVWTGNGVAGNTFDPTGLSGNITVTYAIGTAPCVGVDAQDIIVNPDVDPTWVAPTTLCDDSPLFDLTSALTTGTTGGTWSGTGVTGNNFDPASGTQTITYSVGIAPCVETLALAINVGSAFDPSWTSLTMCTSSAPLDLTTQITGDLGGTWSGTGMTASVFDPFSGTQSITYTVVNGSCPSSLTQDVIVVNPVVTTAGVNISCFGLTDGSVSANVSGGSGNYTYSWDSIPVQTTATATNLAAGTYTVTVTDVDGGCSVTSQVTIVEPAQLNATLNATDACYPNLGVAVVTVSGGVGPFNYVWSNSPSTIETATNLDSAMHTVDITDGSGCTFTDSILVQIFPSPTATVNADTTMIYGEPLLLTAGGGVTYQWSPDYEMDCDTCQNPYINPDVTTTYCVEVTDTNNCMNSACVLVTVEIVCGEVFVPSGFSPNGDGENELECIYSDCMESFVFSIYNRWGEKVFETSSMNICWDGTWKGKELNSGVFIYSIEGYLINGERISQKGNISLIR